MGYYGYRHPETTSENRFVSGYETDRREDDMLPPVRGKRKKLPNAWDDVVRSDGEDRNWKRFRKYQWKSKEEREEKKSSKFRGHTSIWSIRKYAKAIWAYGHYVTLRVWNPDGERTEYDWERRCMVKKKGSWDSIWEWRWQGKKPHCCFYEGEQTKTWRMPIVKCDPRYLNGEPYFDGWETIEK